MLTHHYNSFPYSLAELVDEIPNSLIKSNDAVQDILLALNQHNKQLLAHVATLIKEKRNELKEKEEAAKSRDEVSIKQFEEAKKELGL